MRIGIFVNELANELDVYTTTRVAMILHSREHEVWDIDCDDFAYDVDEKIRAWAVAAPKPKYSSAKAFLADLRSAKGRRERITVSDLDVLFLRSSPGIETGYRAWAQDVGIIFGRVAMHHGVIVVNDPDALAAALDKTYLELLPQSVRPQTIVTQDRSEIKDFVAEIGGSAVLKPLAGIGEETVFVVTPSNRANLNQMIEAITRNGYAIAQEYLREDEEGTTRLFLKNGDVLRYRGKIAAFQRVRTSDTIRANIHTPGATQKVKLTDAHFRIAEAVRPRLVQDGMFLVGLDVVDALERKAGYMGYYHRNFANVEMAVL